MPCSGRYATVDDYNRLMCAGVDTSDPVAVADIEAALDIAASDIQMALQSVGACDCTLTPAALVYLAKLNVIDAAVLQNCPCGNSLNDEQRQMWLNWLNEQYQLIREGRNVLCEGETGSDYIAFGHAEQSLTDFTAEQIALNRIMRTR